MKSVRLATLLAMREGIVLGLLKIPIGSPETVRNAALASLVSRFDGWRRDAAARLAPLAWRRVYDLGPLPLVRAVVAACS